jgi:hypothetical protein
MKLKISIISIVFSVIAGCASYSSSENDFVHLKYFNTSLPKAKWEWGYGGENKQQGMNEYVHLGETVQNWKELVTEQYVFMFDENLLSKYVSIIESQLRNGSKDFKWTVIEKNDSSIVYEWSHKGSGVYPPTYEVAKLIVANGGLYRLAYDKYTEEIDGDILEWEKIIKNAKIK